MDRRSHLTPKKQWRWSPRSVCRKARRGPLVNHRITSIMIRLALLVGLAKAVATGQVFYKRIKSFGSAELITASNPAATLVEGSDGALYGTARGGRFRNGT